MRSHTLEYRFSFSMGLTTKTIREQEGYPQGFLKTMASEYVALNKPVSIDM
jgi:hypothetical protein